MMHPGQQGVDHPGDGGFAVGSRHVDGRIVVLRRAENVHQRRDTRQRRFDLGLGPALVEQMLDLKQRRDLVRCRSRRRSRIIAEGPTGPRCGRLPRWPARCRSRILATTSSGALARNASLLEFRCGTGRFLLCGRKILLQAATLGGNVSTVPDVSTSTTTVPRDRRTSMDAVGLKPSPASVSHASAVTAATWLARSASVTPPSRAGTFCRSARPWSLWNRLTSVTSFCMSEIRCAAITSSAIPDASGHAAITRDTAPGSSPINAVHNVSVTNGITGWSNLSRLSSTVASTAVVPRSPRPSCTFASSTYQSQNSSHAK